MAPTIIEEERLVRIETAISSRNVKPVTLIGCNGNANLYNHSRKMLLFSLD